MCALNKKSIRLVCLVDVPVDSQLIIRSIRNEENVRKWMYSDHMISEKEHFNWLEKVRHDDTQIVFAVLDDNSRAVGVVSVNAINKYHKRCDWAYYLTETSRGGLGSALEFTFLNFIFEFLDIEKLNCEVIEGNDAVVKMHKKFAFVDEGFRRENIIKSGKRLGVNFLGLTKNDWYDSRDKIFEKYHAVFNKFDINIEYNK
ncbi:UDP-4-amino-4,6-dideoxy-N-acetyl-beta-L-altrosamine N-acetyltransferase [Serratia fonticola]|uniref:UDP-4-amino-4, 6-dideoxy-N-acetyl-beta-L-altrosamine N-acetyltransferase n=1 Tax=Serratia fonticola TaxID=47917 RepID=UPI003AFFD802